MRTSHLRSFALTCGLVLWLGAAAQALLPPLGNYTYRDGERSVALQTPLGWQPQNIANGLHLQRDPQSELFGTAMLGFYEYDQAPDPQTFLQTALDQWAGRYDRWQVLSTTAPPERPRVRLAAVSFSLYGFPCRGYVMAVIGKETGTIGFTFGEAVTARQLRLDDLVQLLVAGSYGAFPIRGDGADDGSQATKQAIAKLYGDTDKDFQQLWNEMSTKKELALELLPACATYQPELRELKAFLASYLPDRPKERVSSLRTYCLPTNDFNAFALGRNNLGPGFLAFHAYYTQAFAAVAQQYTSLRDRKLTPERAGTELTAFTAAVSEAILKGQKLPAPAKIDFADAAVCSRFVRVFRSMIGFTMAHEMAHYYLRHSESGESHDAFSVQQREIAADTAAIQLFQTIADDKTKQFWEGGAIHTFGVFATIDNVKNGLKGDKPEPEWLRDHPAGKTRLDMARAALGPDTFNLRNDPWSPGAIEAGSEGIQVVGHWAPGGSTKLAAFTHPGSKATIPIPEGWTGTYDDSSQVFTLRPVGQAAGFPLLAYSAGGRYAGPQAITDEVISELKKSAKDYNEVKNAPFKTGVDELKAHFVIAKATLGGTAVGIVSMGVMAGKNAHALLLVTPVNRYDADTAVFDKLIGTVKFPT